MNKKDFHNIRNQFNRIINSFDQSQISTQKIISICFDAQNNLSDFLNQFSLEDYPIFLSNNEFSAYSFGKEYSFSFYSEDNYRSNSFLIFSIKFLRITLSSSSK